MIAIGIGCRRGASQEAIRAMIEQALAQVRDLREQTHLFSIEAKSGEAGLVGAAKALNLPLEFVSHESLREAHSKIATRSPFVEARFGVGSVSEAAALAGAGQDARLLAPRIACDGVTCAVARGSGR